MVSNDCFISYRRATSAFVARAIFQDLRKHSIDAFLDVEAIDEGDFRKVIETQIQERPYFLPIFSPAALERCRESSDLLRKEFETAIECHRRIVPLVTADFDRKEILACLPEPLATRYQALNTVTVDHEYFEASMDKLRNRFLKPLEVQKSKLDSVLTRDAERLTEVAARVTIGPDALSAQKHFERAFAATDEKSVFAEFTRGSDLLRKTAESKALVTEYDLMYLELQAHLQRQNQLFAGISNMMKAKHDATKTAIDGLR
jgi:hypothetical protein